MKIYYHPISTTSRMIALFVAESGIKADFQVVDLFTGEHVQPAYAALNPSCLVPMLEDGDFRLTESSAILKYLADKIGSPAYPKELRQRAKVNEMMDWLNTQFYRDFGYGLVYPQLFPHLKRPTDEQQSGTVAWGKEKSKGWLKILDANLIGPKNAYLCGNEITIADYFGAGIFSLNDIVRCDLAPWPNVQRWLKTMRTLKSWDKVHEDYNKKLVESTKNVPFVMF